MRKTTAYLVCICSSSDDEGCTVVKMNKHGNIYLNSYLLRLWLHSNVLIDILFYLDPSYIAWEQKYALEMKFKSSTPDVGVAPRDVDWLIPHREPG